jgi:hypothetical protein
MEFAFSSGASQIEYCVLGPVTSTMPLWEFIMTSTGMTVLGSCGYHRMGFV